MASPLIATSATPPKQFYHNILLFHKAIKAATPAATRAGLKSLKRQYNAGRHDTRDVWMLMTFVVQRVLTAHRADAIPMIDDAFPESLTKVVLNDRSTRFVMWMCTTFANEVPIGEFVAIWKQLDGWRGVLVNTALRAYDGAMLVRSIHLEVLCACLQDDVPAYLVPPAVAATAVTAASTVVHGHEHAGLEVGAGTGADDAVGGGSSRAAKHRARARRRAVARLQLSKRIPRHLEVLREVVVAACKQTVEGVGILTACVHAADEHRLKLVTRCMVGRRVQGVTTRLLFDAVRDAIAARGTDPPRRRALLGIIDILCSLPHSFGVCLNSNDGEVVRLAQAAGDHDLVRLFVDERFDHPHALTSVDLGRLALAAARANDAATVSIVRKASFMVNVQWDAEEGRLLEALAEHNQLDHLKALVHKDGLRVAARHHAALAIAAARSSTATVQFLLQASQQAGTWTEKALQEMLRAHPQHMLRAWKRPAILWLFARVATLPTEDLKVGLFDSDDVKVAKRAILGMQCKREMAKKAKAEAAAKEDEEAANAGEAGRPVRRPRDEQGVVAAGAAVALAAAAAAPHQGKKHKKRDRAAAMAPNATDAAAEHGPRPRKLPRRAGPSSPLPPRSSK